MHNPFKLLQPFQNHLDVAFFTKADQIFSKEDVQKAINAPKLVSLKQVHGNRIIRVSEETYRTEEADGLMTDVPNLALEIRIADCQAILVYAPEAHVVGLIHAGWRGLEAGIIPSFFRLLEQEFKVPASSTITCAVPSLCKKCAEFTDPLLELPNAPRELIDGRCVDLQRWADLQLQDCGVLREHMERMPGCTKCESATYWTYRGGDREAVKNKFANMLVTVLRSE